HHHPHPIPAPLHPAPPGGPVGEATRVSGVGAGGRGDRLPRCARGPARALLLPCGAALGADDEEARAPDSLPPRPPCAGSGAGRLRAGYFYPVGRLFSESGTGPSHEGGVNGISPRSYSASISLDPFTR